MIAFVKSQ